MNATAYKAVKDRKLKSLLAGTHFVSAIHRYH